MELPFKMIISNEIEQWRYDTFWDKEPETLKWIDSFKDGDTFFDVGANIGIYSLYCAAIHPNCNIWSFEADLNNYYQLEKNVRINYFFSILPQNYIISDKSGKMGFKTKSSEMGSSGGQMEEHGSRISETIDSLSIFSEPNHIKIDIDGQEWKVVQGMTETLKNKNLKSVLIEINDNKIEIFKAFYDAGFTSDNRFNFLENHSRVRREKEGIKAENIIFTRREK